MKAKPKAAILTIVALLGFILFLAAREQRQRQTVSEEQNPSKNDLQSFTIVNRRGQWLIGTMSAARSLRMPVPYGTPAYPLETDVRDTEKAKRSSRDPATDVTP
ncbi:MAG: hypothetical protein ACUVX8_03605 [Candidatus Zipacnadales bacterium]